MKVSMPLENKTLTPLIVTIDGPAGAGKTTVSRMLARELGYRYIDTGALYRGVAMAVQEAGIAADDDEALVALCSRTAIDLEEKSNGLRLMLNHVDITDKIRSPQITMLASAVSARPVIRNFLLEIQRKMGEQKAVVLEGRDMGTVVFPKADVKFFLDADSQIRARRRYAELKAKGGRAPSLEDVEQDLNTRDKNDSTRSVAPLRPADDAIHIDSTQLDADQVVASMLAHISDIIKKINQDSP